MRLSRSSLVLLGASGCSLFHSDPPPQCPTERTMVIASQGDVTAFTTCKSAAGVAIRSGATIDVSPMTALDTITGDLLIGPTVGVETIALTELREVDGAIIVSGNGSMHGLFLPRLERAGRISIEGNVSLTSIAMPRLAETTGGITIADNHDLEVFDAQALVRVGGDLVITNHPSLTVLELGSLKSAAAVRVDGDPKLGSDVVDALRAHAEPP